MSRVTHMNESCHTNRAHLNLLPTRPSILAYTHLVRGLVARPDCNRPLQFARQNRTREGPLTTQLWQFRKDVCTM